MLPRRADAPTLALSFGEDECGDAARSISRYNVQVPNVRSSVMDIPVLIEPVAGNGYRAKCGEPLPITAEGKTRDEALANLRRLVEERVAAGAEVAALSLRGDGAANPWVEFAGMYDP